jgi:S1-C subfamily serine protease
LQLGRVIRPDTGITRVLQTEQGLIVATMQPGGPAERAGLRGFRIVKERKSKGPFVYETQTIDRSYADMITAVDGEAIHSASDFLGLIDAKHPGDEVVLTIVREGQTLQLPLRLSTAE